MEKMRKIKAVLKKVSFEEAEENDNNYYASLSYVERLEILMDLRSMIDPGTDKISPVVYKKQLHEKEV